MPVKRKKEDTAPTNSVTSSIRTTRNKKQQISTASIMQSYDCENRLKQYKFIIPVSDEDKIEIHIEHYYIGIISTIENQTEKADDHYVYSKIEINPTILSVFIEPPSSLRQDPLLKELILNKQDIFTSGDPIFECFRKMLPAKDSVRNLPVIVSDSAVLVFLYNNSSMYMPDDISTSSIVKLAPISAGGKSSNKRTNRRVRKNKRTRKNKK
jgi:hypothetical protein